MDGSSNMYNSIRYSIVLEISITTLLIFGLYTFPLSQRTNAQLQSDKLDYKLMASDNNIFSIDGYHHHMLPFLWVEILQKQLEGITTIML
jgi:hypothetical protein